MEKTEKKKRPEIKPYNGTIPRQPMAFVWYMAKQFKGWGILALTAVTFAILSGALVPYIFGRVIDMTAAGDVQSVFVWIGVFVGVTALGFAMWRLSGFFGQRFVLGVERKAHLELFSYLAGHSQTYFNNKFAGSLSAKVSNGADGAEHMLDSILWSYYGIFLNLVITGVYIATVSMKLSLFFVGMTVLLFVLNYFLVKQLIPLVVEYGASTSRFRGFIVDSLTNMFAVKSYARLAHEYSVITEKADDRYEKSMAEWRRGQKILIINNVIVVGIQAVLFGGSAYLWSQGQITAGVLVMLLTVFYRVQGDLIFIGNNIRQFIRIYGTIEEGLSEILVDHDLVDARGAQPLKASGGTITWNNVTFKYEENTVFDAFNLTIAPGQRMGLVGQSGAGKTTFVSLLLRQHDLDSGSICIDGQDISGVTQDSLRTHIAVVPQEPMLFHRSIRENIAYGNPDATIEDIIEVAKKAEAHDFIASLPEGYDTLVGERGVKLSGGQKQRVAIARAMLKNAPILILDEATSALDSESEVAIQKALHVLMEGKTVIAIAHRLSTLREMDRIIVLEKGKIVEDGTHTTLVQKKGLYARLWTHQAGGFLVED